MKAYLIIMVVFGILGIAIRMWVLADFKNRNTETTQGTYSMATFVNIGFTVWALFLLLNLN